MRQIFYSLIFIILSVFILSLLCTGNLFGFFVVFLGATYGVAVAVTSQTSMIVTFAYILGLLMSISAVIIGFENHDKVIGQASAVLGFVGWFFLGTMALLIALPSS